MITKMYQNNVLNNIHIWYNFVKRTVDDFSFLKLSFNVCSILFETLLYINYERHLSSQEFIPKFVISYRSRTK